MIPTLNDMIRQGGFFCPDCEKKHEIDLRRLHLCRGAIENLPEEIRLAGGTRVFLLADPNTWAAAGQRAKDLLTEAGIPTDVCVLSDSHPAPNEESLGDAAMHLQPNDDVILGVGGGVINDISKMLAYTARRPYIYLPTAPSMDGFASATASVDLRGLKRSLPSAAAVAVLADTDILAAAPVAMIRAGIGDMTAKIISLAEWKLGHIITGEYYCPTVDAMVADSLARVMQCARAAVQGDPNAIATLTEGLILTGLAMRCAGVSRPASGCEHYFSHLRDMRALAFGTRADFHGTQCGVSVLPLLRLYATLPATTPDRAKALAHAKAFRYEDHAEALRRFVGAGSEEMIELESREGKYDPNRHAARLEIILARWEEILDVVNKLPREEERAAFYEEIGFPTSPAEIGIEEEELRACLRFAGDIRDKYVLPRLLWDLGLSKEITLQI